MNPPAIVPPGDSAPRVEVLRRPKTRVFLLITCCAAFGTVATAIPSVIGDGSFSVFWFANLLGFTGVSAIITASLRLIEKPRNVVVTKPPEWLHGPVIHFRR